jgi:hypothetical protein
MKCDLTKWGNTQAEWLHRTEYGNCGKGRKISSLRKYLAIKSSSKSYKIINCVLQNGVSVIICVWSELPRIWSNTMTY